VVNLKPHSHVGAVDGDDDEEGAYVYVAVVLDL
jgi:hypothetical protein